MIFDLPISKFTDRFDTIFNLAIRVPVAEFSGRKNLPSLFSKLGGMSFGPIIRMLTGTSLCFSGLPLSVARTKN